MMASENAQLKDIYTKGLGVAGRRRWSSEARRTSSAPRPRDQTALLDLIAYRRNQTPELAPGIEFFTWARRMTVDAFYTSEIGIADIDYRGNTATDDVSRTDRGDRVRVEKERARVVAGS